MSCSRNHECIAAYPPGAVFDACFLVKLSGNLDLSRYAYAEDVAKRRLAAANAKTVFDVGAGDGIMRRPLEAAGFMGSSRVDLQACKLEYSIVSPK